MFAWAKISAVIDTAELLYSAGSKLKKNKIIKSLFSKPKFMFMKQIAFGCWHNMKIEPTIRYFALFEGKAEY